MTIGALMGGVAMLVSFHLTPHLPTPREVPHNTHLSHARVVLEGNVVIARIRMFRDDLQKAIKRPITEDSAAQGTVAAYVSRNFGVRADGAVLSAEMLDAAADQEGDQPVWWVLVQWKAARPITQLGIRDHLLFDQFNDQQNLVIVSRQPGDDRRSLYFQPGDRTEQVVKFQP